MTLYEKLLPVYSYIYFILHNIIYRYYFCFIAILVVFRPLATQVAKRAFLTGCWLGVVNAPCFLKTFLHRRGVPNCAQAKILPCLMWLTARGGQFGDHANCSQRLVLGCYSIYLPIFKEELCLTIMWLKIQGVNMFVAIEEYSLKMFKDIKMLNELVPMAWSKKYQSKFDCFL